MAVPLAQVPPSAVDSGTPLTRRLLELRAKAIEKGMPLLSMDEINQLRAAIRTGVMIEVQDE